MIAFMIHFERYVLWLMLDDALHKASTSAKMAMACAGLSLDDVNYL